MALGVAFEPYFDPTMAVLTTVYQKFRATPGMVGEEEEVELLRAFLDTMTAFCQFYGRDRQGCMSPFMVMIAELCNSVVLLICATGGGEDSFREDGHPTLVNSALGLLLYAHYSVFWIREAFFIAAPVTAAMWPLAFQRLYGDHYSTCQPHG